MIISGNASASGAGGGELRRALASGEGFLPPGRAVSLFAWFFLNASECWSPGIYPCTPSAAGGGGSEPLTLTGKAVGNDSGVPGGAAAAFCELTAPFPARRRAAWSCFFNSRTEIRVSAQVGTLNLASLPRATSPRPP